MARAISKARLRLVLLLTLLTGMVFAGVVPAHAAGSASISGTVTVPAGADVTQAVVLLLVETPEGYTMPDAETTPDATGAYTFTGIWPGRFKVVFAHPATTVVWNGGASSEETAPWIELADGQSVTGVDATLALAGSIAGTVTFADGAEPEQVVVTAFLDGSYDFPVMATATDPDGQYILENLAPGSYKLNFMGSAASVWNGNSLSPETAPAIVVAEGAAIAGEDVTFTVDPGAGSISGTVSFPEGQEVAGARIELVDASTGVMEAEVIAESDGSYFMDVYRPGDYKVRFFTYSGPFVGEWYANAAREEDATIVSVAPGQQVTGIDGSFYRGAAISGRVSGAPGIDLSRGQVSVRDGHTTEGPANAWSEIASDGSYSIVGLPAGTYTVCFNAAFSGGMDSCYGGQSPENARPVSVALGQAVANVNISTQPAGLITGTVDPSYGNEFVRVAAYSLDGVLVRETRAAPGGSYRIPALAPGNYKVQFGPGVDAPITGWYGGGKALATAATVTVAAGQTVTGIDSDVIITPRPTPTEKPAPPQKPAGSATSTQEPAEGEPSREPAEVAAAATAVEPAGTATTPQAAANSAGVQRASASGAEPVSAANEVKAGDLATTGEAANTGSPATTGKPAASGDLAEASAPADLTPLGLALGVLGAAGVAIFLTARLRARR